MVVGSPRGLRPISANLTKDVTAAIIECEDGGDGRGAAGRLGGNRTVIAAWLAGASEAIRGAAQMPGIRQRQHTIAGDVDSLSGWMFIARNRSKGRSGRVGIGIGRGTAQAA